MASLLESHCQLAVSDGRSGRIKIDAARAKRKYDGFASEGYGNGVYIDSSIECVTEIVPDSPYLFGLVYGTPLNIKFRRIQSKFVNETLNKLVFINI